MATSGEPTESGPAGWCHADLGHDPVLGRAPVGPRTAPLRGAPHEPRAARLVPIAGGLLDAAAPRAVIPDPEALGGVLRLGSALGHIGTGDAPCPACAATGRAAPTEARSVTDILDRLVAHGDILLAVLLVANDGMARLTFVLTEPGRL